MRTTIYCTFDSPAQAGLAANRLQSGTSGVYSVQYVVGPAASPGCLGGRHTPPGACNAAVPTACYQPRDGDAVTLKIVCDDAAGGGVTTRLCALDAKRIYSE